jgi:hypothetical protein
VAVTPEGLESMRTAASELRAMWRGLEHVVEPSG